MQLEWRTPLVKLDALEKSLNEWLATEENRWFEPSTSVVLQHIEYQRFLEVTIGIGHNGYVHSAHNTSPAYTSRVIQGHGKTGACATRGRRHSMLR